MMDNCKKSYKKTYCGGTCFDYTLSDNCFPGHNGFLSSVILQVLPADFAASLRNDGMDYADY